MDKKLYPTILQGILIFSHARIEINLCYKKGLQIYYAKCLCGIC